MPFPCPLRQSFINPPQAGLSPARCQAVTGRLQTCSSRTPNTTSIRIEAVASLMRGRLRPYSSHFPEAALGGHGSMASTVFDA